jgi:hypothetical protein
MTTVPKQLLADVDRESRHLRQAVRVLRNGKAHPIDPLTEALGNATRIGSASRRVVHEVETANFDVYQLARLRQVVETSWESFSLMVDALDDRIH